MLLNLDPLLVIALGIIFFWAVTLTILFISLYRHYRRLAGHIKAGDLKDILESILKNQTIQAKDINTLNDQLVTLSDDAKLHFQRIGLVRYNPFADTGGDQSFVIALLNDRGHGFVITSLHSRDATRVFAKPVKSGQSNRYDLSKEEQKAVKQALKNNY